MRAHAVDTARSVVHLIASNASSTCWIIPDLSTCSQKQLMWRVAFAIGFMFLIIGVSVGAEGGRGAWVISLLCACAVCVCCVCVCMCVCMYVCAVAHKRTNTSTDTEGIYHATLKSQDSRSSVIGLVRHPDVRRKPVSALYPP